ncbi:MAG TPA: pantoate--beta-alanine ligase [Candidatus Anammoximicrobium sp.]|nr:pantoate--beta-alanine ligase [Candidatus Anammoximicrobium sp.]
MSAPTPLRAERPKLVHTAHELRAGVRAARAAGRMIGLVPTMGALHEGHLSLVRASQAEGGFTIVTIFVNPTQFGPHEDFDKYPRTLPADLEALASCRADLVFAPSREAMYPAGCSTFVEPPRVGQRWEDDCRPGHFRGVATVVLKLFHLAQADVAFFGQKDYQQAAVVRRMVQDLNVPIEIRVCPTVREPDGLAMSSRNRYLSADQRQQALAISRSLRLADQLAASGERQAARLVEAMQRVLAEAQIRRIDYVAVVDPETLEPVSELAGPVMALIAAKVGTTRLIDNWRIETP